MEDPTETSSGDESASRILLPSDDAPKPLGPTAFTHSVPLTPVDAGPIQPDPEGDALRARLTEQRRTGEWEPWFIDLPEEQDEHMRMVGLPRQLRERAAHQLRRLYTPRCCRKMLNDKHDREVMNPLFNRWLPWIIPFVRLGLDLEAAHPWSDKKILGDLRSFANFSTAQIELEVWASLVRRGYLPAREPLGPDGRRPDFEVHAGGRRYVIEVKTLRPSAGEELANDLRTAMQTYAEHLRRPEQTARVCATTMLRRLLDTVEGRASLVGEDGRREFGELRGTLGRIADDGSLPGSYPAGEWFTIDIAAGSEHAGGVVSAAVWDGPEAERRAVRIASLVESALPQIPPTAEGIPLIEIVHRGDISAVARELYRRARDKPVAFSPVAFVVLRWSEPASPFEFRNAGTTIALRREPTGPDRPLVWALIG